MNPYVGYQNSVAGIKYPFSERANVPAEIPQRLIMDVLITTKFTNPVAYLKKIIKGATQSYLEIDVNSGTYTIAIPLSGTNLVASAQDTNGIVKIVIGETILNLTIGEHSYIIDQTEIETSCVIANAKYIDSITVVTPSGNRTFTDYVKLYNGYNTELQANGQQVTMAAISGTGLGPSPCGHNTDTTGITQINNDPVTSANLTIGGSDCVEIRNYPDDHIVAVLDRCEPCCGNCGASLVTMSAVAAANQVIIDDLDTRITALGG